MKRRAVEPGVKHFLIGFLAAGAACAQLVSAGAAGGVPFTDAVSTVQNGTYTTVYKSTNFIVGPALQVNLPASLRFEFDALYRPVSFQLSSGGSSGTTSASQWQFPLLLQYRFKTPVVKPYVSAGLSFDHLSGISAAASTVTTNPGAVLHSSGTSVVFGGGVDVKVPFVRVSGEIRFSHANAAEFQSISNVNQAELLIGLHF